MDKIITEILLEREMQKSTFSDQDRYSLPYWIAILGEEFGECCKAVVEMNYDDKHEFRRTLFELRSELVQVACVAMAVIENMDKGIGRDT